MLKEPKLEGKHGLTQLKRLYGLSIIVHFVSYLVLYIGKLNAFGVSILANSKF